MSRSRAQASRLRRSLGGVVPLKHSQEILARRDLVGYSVRRMTVQVSVIATAYNTGKFLRDAIRSVLMQSYSAFEILIIDDASTDDTQAVAQELAAGDPRIKY